MRLSIVKKHHQQLLLEVASKLQSDDPKDALEHILNCWVSPCAQQLPQQLQIPAASSTQTAPALSIDADIDELISWDS